MKTILLVGAGLFSFTSSNAQIAKGTLAMGLNLKGSYLHEQPPAPNATSNNYTWSTYANPYVEYFFTNNLSLGLGVVYGINQAKDINTPNIPNRYETIITQTDENYALDLFIKKYWFVSSKFAVYAQPRLVSNYYEFVGETFIDNPALNANQANFTTYRNYWNHTAEINFGLTYFIKPKFATYVQTAVGRFNYSKNSYSITTPISTPSLTVGLAYYFNQH